MILQYVGRINFVAWEVMMFQGHKNWAHWNVALWLSNDEPLYRFVCDCVKHNKNRKAAVRAILRGLPERTPDGARYSAKAVYAAIEDWR